MALPQEWKIVIVLGLLALAVVLFARETLPVDVLTLVLLLVLVGTGTVSVTTAFSGFSSEIIIMLVSIFILSGALQETGVVDALGVASVSFVTPLEPSCLLVYGPEKYRFMDYVKTGVGLTIILSIIVLILVPLFWPL